MPLTFSGCFGFAPLCKDSQCRFVALRSAGQVRKRCGETLKRQQSRSLTGAVSRSLASGIRDGMSLGWMVFE
jgi:hypothetical protein